MSTDQSSKSGRVVEGTNSPTDSTAEDLLFGPFEAKLVFVAAELEESRVEEAKLANSSPLTGTNQQRKQHSSVVNINDYRNGDCNKREHSKGNYITANRSSTADDDLSDYDLRSYSFVQTALAEAGAEFHFETGRGRSNTDSKLSERGASGFRSNLLAEQTATAPYRDYNCSNYDTCLGLAAALDWESFTCNGCSGCVNPHVLWRAHHEVRKNKTLAAICNLPTISTVCLTEEREVSEGTTVVSPASTTAGAEDGENEKHSLSSKKPITNNVLLSIVPSLNSLPTDAASIFTDNEREPDSE